MREPSGRSVFLVMIPMHLALLVWVWIGRTVFGNIGWMALFLLISVIPVFALALAITTLLSFLRRETPRALTSRQVRAQLLTWAGLFVVGLFMYDVTDRPGSDQTVLTQLFGPTGAMFKLSALLVSAGTLAAIGGWVWLVALLLRDPSRRSSARGLTSEVGRA